MNLLALTKKLVKSYIFRIFLIFVGIIFLFRSQLNKFKFQLINFEVKSDLTIFDLNKPLEPQNIYEPIKCRSSQHIFVTTTLCVHDANKDIYVSNHILQFGVWEPFSVELFCNYLNENPDWLVFDIGAQIGQYTLYSAKMGNKVVCVEPFYDNIIRIHKAAVNQSLESKITLIQNAISNKRNEIKLLSHNKNNIGGQSIIKSNQTYTKIDSNKFLVKTILFDDIVDYLPKNENNQDFKKAIMKIDIEGSEPFAFVHAKKLFDKIDFQVIFMEWGNLPELNNSYHLIKDMMNFLKNYNLKPYDGEIELNYSDWLKWPMDIIWKK